MAQQPDRKLERLGDSVLSTVCSRDEIRMLARAGDLVSRGAGTVLHGERDPNRWSYLLLDGNVAVSRGGDALALSTPGSWFPVGAARPTGRPSATLTALNDVEVLVFGWRELRAALDRMPRLAQLAAV